MVSYGLFCWIKEKYSLMMVRRKESNRCLDFVEGNNINRLDVIFEFTDFFFEKISSDLKGRDAVVQERRGNVLYFIIFNNTTDL